MQVLIDATVWNVLFNKLGIVTHTSDARNEGILTRRQTFKNKFSLLFFLLHFGNHWKFLQKKKNLEMLSLKRNKLIMSKCYTPKCMGAKLKQTHCRSSSLARVLQDAAVG